MCAVTPGQRPHAHDGGQRARVLAEVPLEQRAHLREVRRDDRAAPPREPRRTLRRDDARPAAKLENDNVGISGR